MVKVHMNGDRLLQYNIYIGRSISEQKLLEFEYISVKSATDFMSTHDVIMCGLMSRSYRQIIHSVVTIVMCTS